MCSLVTPQVWEKVITNYSAIVFYGFPLWKYLSVMLKSCLKLTCCHLAMNRRNSPNVNLPISYFYIVNYWLYGKFTKLSPANLLLASLTKAICQVKVPRNFHLLRYALLSHITLAIVTLWQKYLLYSIMVNIELFDINSTKITIKIKTKKIRLGVAKYLVNFFYLHLCTRVSQYF